MNTCPVNEEEVLGLVSFCGQGEESEHGADPPDSSTDGSLRSQLKSGFIEDSGQKCIADGKTWPRAIQPVEYFVELKTSVLFEGRRDPDCAFGGDAWSVRPSPPRQKCYGAVPDAAEEEGIGCAEYNTSGRGTQPIEVDPEDAKGDLHGKTNIKNKFDLKNL